LEKNTKKLNFIVNIYFYITRFRTNYSMQKKLHIQLLPKHLFWDIDIEKLDVEKNSVLIIERIFNRGDLDDIKMLFDYYGLERIKNEIVKAGFLDKKTLNFVSKFLNIPKTEFQCYTKKQSKNVHWNF